MSRTPPATRELLTELPDDFVRVCRAGHMVTEANGYERKAKGLWDCRVCKALQQREYYRRKTGKSKEAGE